MIFRYYKKMLLLLLIAAGMGACVNDDFDNNQAPENKNKDVVTFTVTVPGQQIPTTRSIDGMDEAEVQSIDLLVFNNSGELTEHKIGAIVSQSFESLEMYEVTFTTDLTPNANARTVVILANMPASIVATVAQENAAKEDVLEALTITSASKWKSDPSDYTTIPMYGEIEVTEIKTGKVITGIELTRMLARIDVVNSAEGFSISNVYVVNFNTKGYIEPKWDSDDNPVLNIPTDAYPLTNTATLSDALDYPMTDITELKGEIYLFEAAANPDNLMEKEGQSDHTNAVCLIIKGKRTYDTEESYYRIDFTSEDTSSEPHEISYMPVYRNHLYTIEITAVDGIGYIGENAFSNALQSFGKLDNLKTKMHLIDQSKITDMVFNGQHYIGLGVGEVELDTESGSSASVPCVTNYAYGWQITSIDWIEGGNDWLTAEKEGTDTDKNSVINLETNSANSSVSMRLAYVNIKAANLMHKLIVTQARAPFIRIMDGEGKDVTELTFESETGITPAAQTFTVEWTASSETVGITKTPGTYDFTWQATTNSLSTLPAGGTYTFTIDPAALTQTEIDIDPFMEKSTKLDFTVNNPLLTTDITLRHINYNTVAEVAEYYMLDGSIYSFTIKSNTEWVISGVSDPNGILDNKYDPVLLGQTGGYDTNGKTIYFKVVNNKEYNNNGSIATLTLTDPTGRMHDVAVVLRGVATCGINGTTVSKLIGGNSYLTHMYGTRCWMVQNSMEGASYASAKYYSTFPTRVNGYYYTFDNAKHACPPGWKVPSYDEANALANIVNIDKNADRAKWWLDAAYGAMAGSYFRLITWRWDHWESAGFWWHGNEGRYMHSHLSDNKLVAATVTSSDGYRTVRCVQQ